MVATAATSGSLPTNNVASLLAFKDHPHRKAGARRSREGQRPARGRRGDSITVKVPIGTKASDLYTGEVYA